MSSFRNQQKLEAMLVRGAIGNQIPSCDLCGKESGSQYHELISRGMTVGNEQARELSFQQELCSLLCEECHSRADYDAVDKALWANNIWIYGRKRVEAALARLQATMKTKVHINE